MAAVTKRTLLCAALLLAACGGPGPDPAPPGMNPGERKQGMTFYRDVLPILQRSCQGCHVAGGIASFSLGTYDESRAVHPLMASAVQARRMPPWMPKEEGCQPLQGARRLTQNEIDTISSWSAAGAPAGDPADAPPAPEPLAALPWVDATVDAGVDYTPKEQRRDDYHCLIVDPKLQAERELIGYEILPGARRLVHHVLAYAAARAEAQAVDGAEPGPGWTCFAGPRVQNPRLVAAWVPGMPPIRFPEGTGLAVAASEVLVMQVHYNLSAPPAPDRTQIRLQFAREPVARRAFIASLADHTFVIPGGARGYTTANTLTVPSRLRLYGLAPHMHMLGQRIQVTEGDRCLIDIPRWDFHWQQLYFLSAPGGLLVERGAVVKLTCTFSNPGTTPVRWGEGTADEMCLNYFYVTAP